MPEEIEDMVRVWVGRGERGLDLRQLVGRQVATITRGYPDAYFELNHKTAEAVDGLADRVFAICSRVPKGRYPFSGREPFRACVEERFDGRDIRYHCFYARLSVTRELLRDDYARNLTHDPRLRWRAELYAEVGVALAAQATPQGGRSPRTAVWQLPASGPTLVRRADQVLEHLRRQPARDVPTLVGLALRHGGPTTQSRLANLLAELLTPPAEEVEPDEPVEADPSLRLAVREAVREVWLALGEEDRALLAAIAAGDSYDEIIAVDARFRNRIAVTRAVERLNRGFLEALSRAFGSPAIPLSPPKETLDLILDVLSELSAAALRPGPGGAS